MPTPKRQMALTRELVAQAARPVEDPGPSPGSVYMTDEDYEEAVRDILARSSRRSLGLRLRITPLETGLRDG